MYDGTGRSVRWLEVRGYAAGEWRRERSAFVRGAVAAAVAKAVVSFAIENGAVREPEDYSEDVDEDS
jgi:hypothetical protein